MLLSVKKAQTSILVWNLNWSVKLPISLLGRHVFSSNLHEFTKIH